MPTDPRTDAEAVGETCTLLRMATMVFAMDPRSRDLLLTAEAQLGALLAETAALRAKLAAAEGRVLDLSPWEHSSGPVPDYDSPLGPVFDSGVTYTLGLLAECVAAQGYSLDGATETHDGDVLAAITSILYHADPKWLREYLDENLHPSTREPAPVHGGPSHANQD